MPPLSSYNRFACLEVDTQLEPFTCAANNTEVVQTHSHPPTPPFQINAVSFQPGSVGYP
jgi:hypothetical protein